jgi:quercetin dioxygenase-like cupin family protein
MLQRGNRSPYFPDGEKQLADGPIKVDPDHCTLDFENDDVRVVCIRYAPGEKSVMHGHPKSVVVFLTDCKGRFNYPDGKGEDIEVKGGQAMFTEATEHLPENTSGQPFEVIQIELKR